MKKLVILHDAGFFSSYSKKLEAIVWFYNKYKKLPDIIDSTAQFSLIKDDSRQDLTNIFFQNKNEVEIKHDKKVDFHNDMQFFDYKEIELEKILPFINKYFSPSKQIEEKITFFEKKYQLDFQNLCAVFYRGNDKSTEINLGDYGQYIKKAKEIKNIDQSVAFLVQTDEEEFLNTFLKEFPNSIYLEEIPRINKSNTTVFDQMEKGKRKEGAINFLAATIILSKCKYVISHSGNCGMWCLFYRGTTKNFFQWLDYSWERNGINARLFWQKYKRYLKKIKGEPKYWFVQDL